MQFKNTEDPQQGVLPPGVAEEPPLPCHGPRAAPRGHPRLRHRCPLGCNRAHASTHPSNNELPQDTQGTPQAHPQPQTRLVGTPFFNSNHHQHHHHQNPNYRTPSPPQPPQQHSFHYHHQHQRLPTSSDMISRGVTEMRVPPPVTQQPFALNYFTLPLIPVEFRRRAIQYMSKRLQMGVNIENEEQTVTEIEKRILTLEERVYNSTSSQDEYITKLASRLAAILQHIDKCRSTQASVSLQSQQEQVM